MSFPGTVNFLANGGEGLDNFILQTSVERVLTADKFDIELLRNRQYEDLLAHHINIYDQKKKRHVEEQK